MRKLMVLLLIGSLAMMHGQAVSACPGATARSSCCGCSHPAIGASCCCSQQSQPAAATPESPTPGSIHQAVLPGEAAGLLSPTGPVAAFRFSDAAAATAATIPLFLLTGAFLS